MRQRPPVALYLVRATFRAPLEFVYGWCTDYTANDSSLSKEGYIRRILRRSPRTVVLEDLYDTREGWTWLRRVIRLTPPDRWYADSIGSDRAISVGYRLSTLPGGRTQLTIRARRRPYGVGTKNPAKSTWERSITANWTRFGRALERDYERTRSRRNRKRRNRG